MYCFQVSAGRVYDSVLVAAEGIRRAINSGVDLSKPPTYLGFCGDLQEQPENTNGKELARHLNKVKKRFFSLLICKGNDSVYTTALQFLVLNNMSSTRKSV